MPDYYIRTPDSENSRGPFDPPKLQTLAEAGQISENTLYYDEDKEEWLPIALNEVLKNEVFPQRERLSLKTKEKAGETESKGKTKRRKKEVADDEGLQVDEFLAAAEGNTPETRHLKKKMASFEKAASLGTGGIGLMMLLSMAFLLMPQTALLVSSYENSELSLLLNYPFVIVGLFDALMALFLFLAVTEVYPLLRARSMLTLGFGLYLGWAFNDPIMMATFAAAGVGLFCATIAKTFFNMVLAMVFGICGHAYLVYLSYSDSFGSFFKAIQMELIAK